MKCSISVPLLKQRLHKSFLVLLFPLPHGSSVYISSRDPTNPFLGCGQTVAQTASRTGTQDETASGHTLFLPSLIMGQVISWVEEEVEKDRDRGDQ